MEVVASLSQCRTAAAHCDLFTHKSVPVIFEPPCIFIMTYFNGMMLMCVKILPVIFDELYSTLHMFSSLIAHSQNR